MLLTGRYSAAAATPIVADQSLAFGRLTLADAGGAQVVSGEAISTASITSGNDDGYWQISGGGIITPTSDGVTAGLPATSYALGCLINGEHAATVTLTIEADTYSVLSLTEIKAAITAIGTPASMTVAKTIKGRGVTLTGTATDNFLSSKAFAKKVTLTSHDLADPMTFEGLKINGSTNVSLIGLGVYRTYTGSTMAAASIISLEGTTSNLELRDNDIGLTPSLDPYEDHTSTAFAAGDIYAINMNGAGHSNLTIAGNTLHDCAYGVHATQVASGNLVIDDNDIYRIWADGVQVAGQAAGGGSTFIRGNRIREIVSLDGDEGYTPESTSPHADCIQIIGNGTPTSDFVGITIERNEFWRGAARGDGINIIFTDNSGFAGKGYYFKDVRIVGNYLGVNGPNSIRLRSTKDALVANNTCACIRTPEGLQTSNDQGIEVAGSGNAGTITIRENIAESYTLTGTGATIVNENNITLGKDGATIPFNNIFDGTDYEVTTLAGIRAAYNAKAGGAADLASPKCGCYGSGYIDFANQTIDIPADTVTPLGGSYDLTLDNRLNESSNSSGLTFPTDALKLPTSGNSWVFGMFFHVPENMRHGSNTQTLASKGTSVTGSGGGDASIWINEGNASNPLSLSVRHRLSGVDWFPTADQPVTTTQKVERGKSYLVLLAQVSTIPHIVLVETDGTIVSNDAGTATALANNVALFNHLGAALGVTGNQYGFEGSLQDAFMIHGAFPNSGGVLDVGDLADLATGVLSPQGLATAISGTLQYFNALDINASLAADGTGTVTSAMTAVNPNTPVLPGPTIVPKYDLTIDRIADGYVWGVKSGETTGTVKFSGTYSVGTPTIQARLRRVDTGAAFTSWANVGTVSAGVWSATINSVPAGVGFTIEARDAASPDSVVSSGSRYGVGIVLYMSGQSQAALISSPASGSGNGSGTGVVTPTEDSNKWGMMISPLMLGSVPSTPTNNIAQARKVREKTVGLTAFGDGILALMNRVMEHSGFPVMVVNGADSGKAPVHVHLDGETVTMTNPAGFAPDGVETAFDIKPLGSSITWALDGVGSYGSTSTITWGRDPTIKPGTLVITTSTGVVITDDGEGALSGTGVTGTVDYRADLDNASSITLTFTSAPAAGMTLSLEWALGLDWIDASTDSRTALTGFTTFGEIGTPGSGLQANLLTKLGDNVVTAAVIPWWGTFLPSYSGASDMAAAVAGVGSNFDLIKARLQRDCPAFADTIFHASPAARDVPTSGTTEGSDRAKHGAHRVATRTHVAANADYRMLSEQYDTTQYNNSGPHSDASGSLMQGDRYGASVAAGLGFGSLTVEGPYIESATINVGRDQIDVVFAFADPVATALATRTDGAFAGTEITGITGFEVGSHASTLDGAFAARSISGFTASIISATTVRLTKTSGTWAAVVSLSYAGGVPVFTGTANKTADEAALAKMLFDNNPTGKYSYPIGSVQPGNLARPTLNLQVS